MLCANYLAARLKHRYSMPFPPPYAHEFVTVPRFDDKSVSENDIAKRLLDHGIHPPTMSWPIQHCLMVERSARTSGSAPTTVAYATIVGVSNRR